MQFQLAVGESQGVGLHAVWCRFVPSLRGDGIDVVIGVFKALCILGGETPFCHSHCSSVLVVGPGQDSSRCAQHLGAHLFCHAFVVSLCLNQNCLLWQLHATSMACVVSCHALPGNNENP